MDLLLSSLSSACSLTELDLSDCNLTVIPNDIGCLFALRDLILSGNDFVCLPESINRLSNLRWMRWDNCTSLRSLLKLPLNIEYIGVAGCVSLEMLSNPFESNDLFRQVSLSLFLTRMLFSFSKF